MRQKVFADDAISPLFMNLNSPNDWCLVLYWRQVNSGVCNRRDFVISRAGCNKGEPQEFLFGGIHGQSYAISFDSRWTKCPKSFSYNQLGYSHFTVFVSGIDVGRHQIFDEQKTTNSSHSKLTIFSSRLFARATISATQSAINVTRKQIHLFTGIWCVRNQIDEICVWDR